MTQVLRTIITIIFNFQQLADDEVETGLLVSSFYLTTNLLTAPLKISFQKCFDWSPLTQCSLVSSAAFPAAQLNANSLLAFM